MAFLFGECRTESIKRIYGALASLDFPAPDDFIGGFPQISRQLPDELQTFYIGLINRVNARYRVGTRAYDTVIGITSRYLQEITVCGTLAVCCEAFERFVAEVAAAAASERPPTLIGRVMEYAERNYHNPITLADAAEYVRVTGNHLSSLFKKEIGCNFTEYIVKLRVRKACELLASEDDKLYKIAARCGFNDQAYFTRVFKQYTGVSPLQYRQRAKGASVRKNERGGR